MTARRRRPMVRQVVRVAGLAGAATLVALLLTSASTSAPSGLVAAYAFDEGSGSTVSDASGNGNTGTISGATWSSAGKYGSALSFNGSSGRVTIPNASSLQLSSGMTLEAWVNPAAVSSTWRDVIEKGNDNYFLMATSDHSSAPGGGGIIGGSYGQVFTTSPLPTNTWSFLALTYDGATERLYLNGTQVASLARTGAITSSTNALTLGSDPFYGQFFNGLLDNIRIYNSALSAAAIQTDMTTRGQWHAGHDPAHGARHADRHRRQLERDRPQLGRGDRQRRHRQLPDLALPGRRLQQLQPGRDDQQRHHHELPGHGPDAPRPATATRCAPSTPPTTPARTATPPAGRPRPSTPSRRPRPAPSPPPPPARPRSTSAGVRRPTTSASPTTRSGAARAQAAATSARSGRRATAPPRATRTRGSAPRPATATRCGPWTPQATPALTATPQRQHAGSPLRPGGGVRLRRGIGQHRQRCFG